MTPAVVALIIILFAVGAAYGDSTNRKDCP